MSDFGIPGTIYLLHFSSRIGDLDNPKGNAGHYLGWASDLEARLASHGNGSGARIMAAVKAAGITWACVRTWDGDRHLERRLKRRHNLPQLCPTCQLAAAAERQLRKPPAKRLDVRHARV